MPADSASEGSGSLKASRWDAKDMPTFASAAAAAMAMARQGPLPEEREMDEDDDVVRHARPFFSPLEVCTRAIADGALLFVIAPGGAPGRPPATRRHRPHGALRGR